MKKYAQEFREFAMRGNVMDLAIGVIIGGAFGKIVSSLVSDVIMPPIGLLVGGVDFKDLVITLKPATALTPAIVLGIGVFLQTVFDFLIITAVIFAVVKIMNRMKREQKKEQATASPSEEVLLLRDIRDALKK